MSERLNDSMSRLKNFSRNLTTSYLQLGVNVFCSLVSIPLILHWLPRVEFGMWAVLVQLMAYISLVDLGINQAIARFLVDHKDRRSEGEYGALLKTSALVSSVQGLIVLAVVLLGSPLLASLMKIPAEYQDTFIALMRLQGVIAAFTFCMNPLGIMLNAHQRMDLVAWQSILNMTMSLALLWLFLRQDYGIYAFIYANAICALITPCQLFWHCRRLGFLPRAGEWGKMSWRQFNAVFTYGKDVFLMNVGIQLIAASQTIVVSRTLGLDAAATWSVGTKVFMLVRQIVYLPTFVSLSGFFEMLARNENERLRTRFQNLVMLTASLGVLLGVTFVLCNSLFIEIWTGGKIVWSPLNDVLLGLWVFIASVQTTHASFVFVTKQIGSLPYVFILEGCTYVMLSVLVGYRWGMSGIIACSLLCLVFFSCQFSLRRSARYFKIGFGTLVFDWLLPSWKLAAMLVPIALIIWFATSGLPTIWRLAIHGMAAVFIGGLFFLHFGLPSEILLNIQARLPQPAARLFRMLGFASLRSKI
jgi:O-antigen/teichoic acid export membrane protein